MPLLPLSLALPDAAAADGCCEESERGLLGCGMPAAGLDRPPAAADARRAGLAGEPWDERGCLAGLPKGYADV